MNNRRAELHFKEIKKEFKYKDTVILTVKINYPQINLESNPLAQFRINRRYKTQADSFYNYASTKLLKDAIKEYNYSMQNGYPVRAFDAIMQYSVTLNERCHLSTYYDQYEYTGGAHGITKRFSDNWNLQSGKYIKLKNLFPFKNYRQLILAQIIKMADKEPDILFENYKDLIIKNFDEDSFNLKPNTIMFYYQHYDIGPYASGIIEFDIPYITLKIDAPDCKTIIK